tara:strand:- start:2 stop:2335 length:2334 start_codon:yes stop_codon:yes gene_type:complete
MEQPTSRPSSEQTKAILADRSAARAEEHEQNRQDIIAHLKERGLRPEAIAGIVGNIAVETGGSFKFDQMQTRSGDPYDPNTVRFGGYGLFQFDDYSPGQGHRSWYQEYLKDNEKTDSLESQLDYVLDTIFSDSQDTNYKYTERLGVSDAGTLKAYLQTNTDPEQISDAFVDRFEKAGIPHSSRRRDAAMKTFAELSPPDRADISPDDQFLDQPGEIRDTGKVDSEQLKIVDVPEEKSTYEKIKPYVPILRHFNEGGMALEKQMELFEDGGLKDEGGTTDPVSGNDVPPGSTQEEVRDDIPAQLSEGEFVFPADVVRYIGLEKLMQMRQEAKMGLRMMEDMGQMGNSDQAVMPDDIPFDLSDLDMDDDLEYNVGGFVPGQSNPFGIAGTQQSAFAGGVGGYTPYQMPQYGQTPIAQAYTPAQQQFVPTQPVPTTLPTPEQFLPNTPTDPEVTTKEYINPETGEKRIITFVGGQPTIGIPEGFIPIEEYTPDTTTATPTTEVATTTVTDRDDNEPPQSAAEVAEMRARVAAAKKMGITEQVGFSMAGAFGRYGPEDVGKFTPSGHIIGKDGVLLDPLTGMTREQSSPSLIGGIIEAIVGGKEPPKPAYSDEFFDAMPDTAKDVLGRSLGKDARDKRIAEAEEQRKETEARLKAAREKSRAAEVLEQQRIKEEKAAEIAAERNRIAEVQRRAREEMAARESQQQAADRARRESRERQEDRDSGGSGQTRQEKADSYTADRVAEAVSTGDYSRGFAEGGLAAKKKPKAKKQMKRGGLASKK